MKPIALKRSSTGTPYTFTTDPGARGPRLALRLETSTLTRPPSTLSTSTRPTKVSTSPTSSIQRWSPVGTNIGGAATAGGCVGATSATGVEAGTTAGPGAGGRASVVVAFSADGLGCRGAGAAGAAGFVDGGVTTSCAGAAAGVGAEGATGAIGAGRTPCSWASAASALGP